MPLVPVSFDALAGWPDDDHDAALAAFRASASRLIEGQYRERELSPATADMSRVAKTAIEVRDARRFFEECFTPMRAPEQGFLTGFFEPVVRGSRIRTPEFAVPLMRRPDDLIDLTVKNRPAGMSAEMRFARMRDGMVEEHPDRGAITRGALDGRGLELVWVADLIEAFFIHVQGAAKLDLDPSLPADDPDRFMRVTFDGKSGHGYTSLARVLCDRHDIPPAEMTADRLAAWMRDHPAELPDLLARNRSYIFFREVEGGTSTDGPVAAAKVPLIAGRSLAVDRTLHMFGTPVWCETADPLPDHAAPTRRLMVAHDTGSAITGAARGDWFAGSGAAAGHFAGRIRHATTFTFLHPKALS